MSVVELAGLLRQALFVLGVLFAVANARAAWDLVRWLRLRPTALIVWPPPRPPYYTLNLAIGVALGLLLLVDVVTRRPAVSLFGVTMMFSYYAYLLPASTRIRRGLYEEGIWTDGGFMAYRDIGSVSWRREAGSTLVLASRSWTTARPLMVPGAALGEVRRILREKIGSQAIPTDEGPGLHLGGRDTRESV
jgi:hypothetical protein